MSLVLKAQVATLDEGTGSEKDADISSEIVLMKRCSVCEAASTTLVVNKGFVPPLDMCRKILLGPLSRFNQIKMAFPKGNAKMIHDYIWVQMIENKAKTVIFRFGAWLGWFVVQLLAQMRLSRWLGYPNHSYIGGGSRWSATIDRRWPPLTATIHHRWQPLTGGSGDGVETAGRPRGTTQVVTRGVLIISAGVTGSGYEAAGLEVGSGGSEIGSGGSVASLDTPANNGIFWKHTCHSAIGGSWYK
ncbi:hypothetical protein Tco_1576201 [Tanacetum coccineum]